MKVISLALALLVNACALPLKTKSNDGELFMMTESDL